MRSAFLRYLGVSPPEHRRPIFKLEGFCPGMQLDRIGLHFLSFPISRLHSRSAAANVRPKQGPKN
jgi:hypothetical protein